MDTAHGALGHTANDGSSLNAENLQVVDADLNAIKSFVSSEPFQMKIFEAGCLHSYRCPPSRIIRGLGQA